MTDMSTHSGTASDHDFDAIAATIPAALIAIGEHMAERGLPPLLGITIPTAGNGLTHIELHINELDVPAWEVTVHPTGPPVASTRPGGSPNWVHHHQDARLPVGIRIRLLHLTYRAGLASVPVGSGAR